MKDGMNFCERQNEAAVTFSTEAQMIISRDLREHETLMTTQSSLVQQTSDSLSSSLRGVSSRGDEILGRVTIASAAMEAQSRAAMTSFQGFLNDRGDVLTTSLTTHFSVLDESLNQGVKAGVAFVGSLTENYDCNLRDSATAPTGSTPRKMKHRPLEPLPPLRDILLVKEQARVQARGSADIQPAEPAESSRESSGSDGSMSSKGSKKREAAVVVDQENLGPSNQKVLRSSRLVGKASEVFLSSRSSRAGSSLASDC